MWFLPYLFSFVYTRQLILLEVVPFVGEVFLYSGRLPIFICRPKVGRGFTLIFGGRGTSHPTIKGVFPGRGLIYLLRCYGGLLVVERTTGLLPVGGQRRSGTRRGGGHGCGCCLVELRRVSVPVIVVSGNRCSVRSTSPSASSDVLEDLAFLPDLVVPHRPFYSREQAAVVLPFSTGLDTYVWDNSGRKVLRSASTLAENALC